MERIQTKEKAMKVLTYQEMTPFQQRVADEVRELRTKLDKLNQFVETDTFNQLPHVEKGRLLRQRSIMADYAEVLDERIANFS